MAVIIIGKHGYIACRLARRLVRTGPVLTTSSRPAADSIHLDLTKPRAFDYDRIRAGDVALLLAAISSPDICTHQYDFAHSVNVAGTIHFAEQCLRRGAKVLFFSSDTVYGDGAFDERSACQPIGEYAKMKYIVEQQFAREPDFKVFRLSYVFSRDDKFTHYLQQCAFSGKEAEVFHPLLRRIVCLDDVTDAIAVVCAQWDRLGTNVLNLAGPDLLSRVDLARLFREMVDDRLRYKVTEPEAEFFAARPRSIDMSSLHLAALLGRQPQAIRDAMAAEFHRPDTAR